MTKQFKPKTGGRGISWTDETINVTAGCHHACRWEMPDGQVARCYAETTAESPRVKDAYPQGFASHYWHPERLASLRRGKEPLLIFVDSMSDLFAANVPESHTRQVLEVMAQAPHHTYQVLTKAPGRILKFELPSNLWVGISTPPDWFMGHRLTRVQQEAILAKGLDILEQVRSASGNIVWLSAEPLSWDISGVVGTGNPVLDWCVIGAASNGSNFYQPEPSYVEHLLDVLDKGKTAVFYKGNLRPTFMFHDFGSPERNRWREDFPAWYRDGKYIPAVWRRQGLAGKHGWPLNTQVPAMVADGTKVIEDLLFRATMRSLDQQDQPKFLMDQILNPSTEPVLGASGEPK